MTPLRAKYIRDLGIHGRSKHTEEAYTRYVCDLARYYSPFARADLLRGSHGLAVPSHQGASPLSLQRQHRRQRRALSLRRDTWARDARLDGIDLRHEARDRARGQRGRSDLDSAQAAGRPTSDTITSQIHPGPRHSWPLKTHSGSLYQVRP